MDLRQAWDLTVQQLSDHSELSQSSIAFLQMCHFVGDYNGLAMVAVPNEYTRNQIEQNCMPHINATMSAILEADTNVGLIIDPSIHSHTSETEEPVEEKPKEPAVEKPEEPHEKKHLPGVQYSPATASSDFNATNLNPKYSFDTFVIGASNRFATAASKAVAENPALSYNPLFIYGGSGLGKTHLLHAIGLYALTLYPDIKVKYVNSEEFTNEFINTVAENVEFQRRYRNVDILLIDDIQFLQGKERTVEEFFHTFNALHDAEKQVVITSDVPPKKLDGFEERMRSRFEWGLITDVQPPDLETRIAILRKRADHDGLDISYNVLEYIASRFITNIRELEGAMLRVSAFSSLNKQPISLELAEMVLKDIVSDPKDTEITASVIKAQTASYFNVTVAQLCSADRSKALTEARQIAMYLCRELTELSLPKIGHEFGNRDHTTVMHATNKITKLMKNQPAVFDHITELTNRIRRIARNS